MPEIAFVNGEFLPLERAMVHVEDRGFQFADSVYEVLRTYGGRPFAVDEHLDRLERSLAAIDLKCRQSRADWTALIHEAARRAGFPEVMIYLQITRGVAKRHRGIPASYEPTVVITARELPDSSELRRNGVKLITVPDQRWARCDIKSVALLANVLAYHAARQAGGHDAIYCEADGTVNETTAGNLFIVTGGVLRTPPTGQRLLAGVTRDHLLRVARDNGLPAREERMTRAELYAADEMFMSSTTAEVVPVIAVDGKAIGPGVPGPIGAALYAHFLRAVGSPRS